MIDRFDDDDDDDNDDDNICGSFKMMRRRILTTIYAVHVPLSSSQCRHRDLEAVARCPCYLPRMPSARAPSYPAAKSVME